MPLSHEVLVRESNTLMRDDIEALIRASEDAGMMGYGALVAGAAKILDDWKYRHIEFSHEAHAETVRAAAWQRQDEMEQAMEILPEENDFYSNKKHPIAYEVLRDEAKKSEALADAAERYLESKS